MLVRQSRKSEFYFRCVQKSSFFYFDYKEKVESIWITKVQIGYMMRGSIQDRIYSNEEYIWNRERKRSRQLFVWLLGWPPAGVHSLWTMCSTSLWPKWRTRLDWLDSFNMEVRLSVSHLALAHLSFRMAFVQKKKKIYKLGDCSDIYMSTKSHNLLLFSRVSCIYLLSSKRLKEFYFYFSIRAGYLPFIPARKKRRNTNSIGWMLFLFLHARSSFSLTLINKLLDEWKTSSKELS